MIYFDFERKTVECEVLVCSFFKYSRGGLIGRICETRNIYFISKKYIYIIYPEKEWILPGNSVNMCQTDFL